uniref:Uncharacterized protein n=1 Tax=Vespula pensylvanica TaxID=30213 RepID=A0A834NS54_VESPE|nr:hypothetical protein H0235_011545 [Vespula pensylvanica]
MRKRERRNAKSQENSVKALTGDLTERKNVLWLTTQATSRRFINPSKTGSKDEERKEKRAGEEEEEIRAELGPSPWRKESKERDEGEGAAREFGYFHNPMARYLLDQ